MAKGFQQHQERVNALQLLGKDLARRAKSKCEVCETAGVSLQPFEVPPVPVDPVLERCVFVCETCAGALGNEKLPLIGNEWRGLANTIWTEVPVIQVCAVRLLQRVSLKEPWATETLDQAILEPETEAWLEEK